VEIVLAASYEEPSADPMTLRSDMAAGKASTERHAEQGCGR
jgi:hypothetical protein